MFGLWEHKLAKTGNHGIIIPRDRTLLHALYWDQNKTLPEIAKMYGVGHKSVLAVFRTLGIPTRRKGEKPIRGCIVCGATVHRIKHAGNGAEYGRRCKKHWNEHRSALSKMEAATPKGGARKRRLLRRWYYEGPINPTGESQWLSKGRAILRRAKRVIREASQSRKRESEPERSSQT